MAMQEVKIVKKNQIEGNIFIRVGGNPYMISTKEAQEIVENLNIQLGSHGKDNRG